MKINYTFILVLIFAFSLAKAQSGSMDFSFKTDFDFAKTDIINTVAIQKDGKIIIGGVFKVPFLNGNKQENILRLNVNGSFDPSFNIGTGFNDAVNTIVIQSDGKILVGGNFTNFDNRVCNTIIRLNGDGTRDSSFIANVIGKSVLNIALQTDNKIIVGANKYIGVWAQGAFSPILIRLMKDGNRDFSFNGEVVNNLRQFNSIVAYSNNKTIISGDFNFAVYNNVVRIRNEGFLDSIFHPNKDLSLTGAFASLIIQPNGKIIGGGNFKSYKQSQIKRIVRFNDDGSLDSTFRTGAGFDVDTYVRTLFLQKDGKVIAGGNIKTFGGIDSKNIVRLNGNGSIDESFVTGLGFNDRVSFIFPQGEDKIIVVGDFTSYNSDLANRICRLFIKENLLDTELSFSVSPNPTQGIFSIHASLILDEILVLDASGRQILKTSLKSSTTEMDLKGQANGLYFVKVLSGGKSRWMKVLKQ